MEGKKKERGWKGGLTTTFARCFRGFGTYNLILSGD